MAHSSGQKGYAPSFVLSIGLHGGALIVMGLVLSVTGGPSHNTVEMDVAESPRPQADPSGQLADPPPPEAAATPRPRRAPRTVRAREAAETPPPNAVTGPASADPTANALPAVESTAPGVPDAPPGGRGDPSPGDAPGQGESALPLPVRRVYDMADLDAPPALVGNCSADVPAFARQTQQAGWVMVQFTLDPEGRVQTPRIRASAPHGVFDQAALEAIVRCRYTPPRVGGRAVSVTYRQRLRFEP